jgi:hypothetical protein
MRINCIFLLISRPKVHASSSSAQTGRIASKIKTQFHNASLVRDAQTTTRILRIKASAKWYAEPMESHTEASAKCGKKPVNLGKSFRFCIADHAQVSLRPFYDSIKST